MNETPNSQPCAQITKYIHLVPIKDTSASATVYCCSVKGCINSTIPRNTDSSSAVYYHAFPSGFQLKAKWLQAIGRPAWDPPGHARVCSAHFNPQQITVNGTQPSLKHGAVPIKGLPPKPGFKASELTVCRICLATDVKMYSTKHSSLSPFFDTFINQDNINLKGLPEFVCFLCAADVMKCTKFIKKIMKARSLLVSKFYENGQISIKLVKDLHMSKINHSLLACCSTSRYVNIQIDGNNVASQNTKTNTGIEIVTLKSNVLNINTETLKSDVMNNKNILVVNPIPGYNQFLRRKSTHVNQEANVKQVINVQQTDVNQLPNIRQAKDVYQETNVKQETNSKPVISVKQVEHINQEINFKSVNNINQETNVQHNSNFKQDSNAKQLTNVKQAKNINQETNVKHNSNGKQDRNTTQMTTQVTNVDITQIADNINEDPLAITNLELEEQILNSTVEYLDSEFESDNDGNMSPMDSEEDVKDSSIQNYEMDIKKNIIIIDDDNDEMKKKTGCEKKNEKETQVINRLEKLNDNKLTPDEIQLQEHFRVVRYSPKEQLQQFKYILSQQKFTNGVFYQCQVCKMKFANQNHYKNHLTYHDPIHGNVECPICKIRFKKPKLVETHMNRVHGKRFYCKKCPIVLNDWRSAKNHQLMHAGVASKKPPVKRPVKYQCKKCSFSTPHRDLILVHVQGSHSSHACRLCGRACAQAAELRAHQKRAHSDEARRGLKYECNLCGKIMKTSITLDLHMRNVHQKMLHSLRKKNISTVTAKNRASLAFQ